MAHDKSAKDAGTPPKKLTRISSDGQEEMTIADSPLYDASEELVKSKARLARSHEDLDEKERVWIEEMKRAKKKQISHKGDTIELVQGKTTEDHARFKKS